MNTIVSLFSSRPARVFSIRWSHQFITPIAFGLVLLLISLLSPGSFSFRNLQNILLQAAPLGIVVLGQTLVMLVKGLDLSVASVMATAAVIATSFGPTDASAPTILLAALAMGAAVGLINGLIVTKRGVSPFLVTLATMIVLQGIRFAATRGIPSGNQPPIFRLVGTGLFYGLPINFFVLAALTVCAYVATKRLPLGRQVYIVGDNPKSARLVGINVDRTVTICYVACSLLAAVAGLVLVGYVGEVDNWVGKGYELDSIVAAVMGGIALQGGRGNILGALAGALLLVLLANLILQLGLPIQLQMILKGVVVITATALYSRQRR
jgi:ribose/xylose/arabinose/galactoside ABC-type transport system permease subunit